MNRSAVWIFLAVAVDLLIGLVVWAITGIPFLLTGMVICLPIGWVAGRLCANRIRKQRAQEWRDDHPNLSDHWFPKHLR